MGTLDTGGTLRSHAATWADLGVWMGNGTPPLVVSLATWESTKTGYWARLDGAFGLVPFSPTAQTMELVSVAESAVARLSANERARAEALGLTETGLSFLALRCVLAETVTIGETASDAISHSTAVVESRVETLTVAEVVATLLAAIEARSESLTVSESGTTRLNLPEPHTETVTATETASDALASADPFVAFWLQLPRPVQPGKYPYYTATGWVYYTANDLFATLLSATPREGEFWIDTSGA